VLVFLLFVFPPATMLRSRHCILGFSGSYSVSLSDMCTDMVLSRVCLPMPRLRSGLCIFFFTIILHYQTSCKYTLLTYERLHYRQFKSTHPLANMSGPTRTARFTMGAARVTQYDYGTAPRPPS
jgi:hypothetical protein